MWEQQQIAAGLIPRIAVAENRVFWLESDPNEGSVADELGHEIPRQRLRSFDVASSELHEHPGSFPPSHALAAANHETYVWDSRGGGVYRVPSDGEPAELTRIEGHLQGDLRAFEGGLFFVGKIHPGAVGVAHWDPSAESWSILLDTEDPTTSAQALIHVDDDRVWYLRHGPEGWELVVVRPSGESDAYHVDFEDVMPRELAGDENGLALATREGVLFLDFAGERRGFIATDVPPERLARVGDSIAWVANAVSDRDVEGRLLKPWRVQIGRPGQEVETVLESEAPLVQLAGGPWGVASLAVGKRPTFPIGRGVSSESIVLAAWKARE